MTSRIGLLLPTGNVLAIQALNASAGDNDLLMTAELSQTLIEPLDNHYFKLPTAGAANTPDTWQPDIDFSIRHGFYQQPISVALSTTTEDAQRSQVDGLYSARAILLGRVTYQIWATFWPDAPKDAGLTDRINALIARDVPVRERWITDDELDAHPGLVKTMSVKPPRGSGRVRLIEIEGVDLQPCGGTHVRRTGEIGTVVVTDVDSESPAGLKNIRSGDVITEVAQQKITSTDDFSAKLDVERKAGRRIVLLQVSRSGELTFIPVRLDP